MNKFIISELPETDAAKPVLYKVHFSNRYYIHKGKTLKDSLDRLLDDVFRGMRGKKCSELYSNIVAHCLKYPSMHKVSVEVLLNADPAKILRKETALYKSMKGDISSLNRLDLEPYKPEWMVKQSLQERCEQCIPNGIVDGKKRTFKFCPNCGRLNK